jgi:hypothetical protein
MKARNKDSCQSLFRQLNILPLYCQYIFSISMSVVKNLDTFKSNSAIHSINTRQGPDFHFPSNKLVKLQKGVYYSGIKIFNNLPYGIKKLSSDVIKFKLALKRFLLDGSFYSLNEYYEWNTRGDLDSYNIKY